MGGPACAGLGARGAVVVVPLFLAPHGPPEQDAAGPREADQRDDERTLRKHHCPHRHRLQGCWAWPPASTISLPMNPGSRRQAGHSEAAPSSRSSPAARACATAEAGQRGAHPRRRAARPTSPRPARNRPPITSVLLAQCSRARPTTGRAVLNSPSLASSGAHRGDREPRRPARAADGAERADGGHGHRQSAGGSSQGIGSDADGAGIGAEDHAVEPARSRRRRPWS